MPGGKPDSGRADNIPLAVGTIVVTVLALSLGDALIKLASGSFVLWQIFVLRSLIVLPLLVAYLAVTAPSALRLPVGIGWMALRSGMLVAMWVLYYLSLPELAPEVALPALIGSWPEVHGDRALVFADGLDVGRDTAFEPIGISCRICERRNCHQRSVPPLERRLKIEPHTRGVLPYAVE